MERVSTQATFPGSHFFLLFFIFLPFSFFLWRRCAGSNWLKSLSPFGLLTASAREVPRLCPRERSDALRTPHAFYGEMCLSSVTSFPLIVLRSSAGPPSMSATS